ncbi:hypothetical protein OS493_029672, partial [Desmophyllum pertusum]
LFCMMLPRLAFRSFSRACALEVPRRPSSSSYVPNYVAHDVNTNPTLVIGLGPVLQVLTKPDAYLHVWLKIQWKIKVGENELV